MKQHTILVIDDNPDNLRVIVDFLYRDDAKYNILISTNGKLACEIVENKLPNLIITDWDMPEMNGIEVIKHLKKQDATKDIPIIMATGIMTSPENLRTAMEAGAVDYITKPINPIELTARVNSMLKLSDSLIKNKLLNATKDKFFSIVAHDLRAPFSSTIGFSKLLNDNFEHYDIPTQKKYIEIIYEGVTATHKLLENLLIWSRSQRNLIEFVLKTVNINLLFAETIDIFHQLITNKSIIIENKIPENIFVKADKNLLFTILRNLISNSIKFTNKGGKIIIKSRYISNKNNQNFTEIAIEDNGIGISDEILPKLFNISENISTKGTGNESGTGLGLILCKEFVIKHGGEIWVESEVGKGSIFYFTIPAQ